MLFFSRILINGKMYISKSANYESIFGTY